MRKGIAYGFNIQSTCTRAETNNSSRCTSLVPGVVIFAPSCIKFNTESNLNKPHDERRCFTVSIYPTGASLEKSILTIVGCMARLPWSRGYCEGTKKTWLDRAILYGSPDLLYLRFAPNLRARQPLRPHLLPNSRLYS